MSTPKAQSLLSIEWVGPSSTDGVVKMLDQRYLPLKVGYINCTSVEQVHEAIYNMTIRGAPAIGMYLFIFPLIHLSLSYLIPSHIHGTFQSTMWFAHYC